jgi:hypothetical protein
VKQLWAYRSLSLGISLFLRVFSPALLSDNSDLPYPKSSATPLSP